MAHFSFAQVLKGALTGQKNWTPQWPDAQPKAAYEVVRPVPKAEAVQPTVARLEERYDRSKVVRAADAVADVVAPPMAPSPRSGGST